MKKEKSSAMGTPYTFEGRIPLKQAIPLGLQHVMAMFVGNLTPLLIIMGACGLTADAGYGALRTALLQNAMTVAGIVTLVQMFSIGPIGGKVPIVMGTSSGFLGVFKSVTAVLGQGALTYGAILGATIVGGLFEGVLGVCLKPLRKFFPSVVTGCVVMAIGLSLIPVGINYLCGGSGTNDYGSTEPVPWHGRSDCNAGTEALYKSEGNLKHGFNSDRYFSRLRGSYYYDHGSAAYRNGGS